jgi:hypothetical protein
MHLNFGLWFAPPDSHQQGLQGQIGICAALHGPPNNAPGKQIDDNCEIQEALVGADVGSLIDHLRSLILSRVSATCKVLFEVIPFGASSRHPRRRRPEGDIRDA